MLRNSLRPVRDLVQAMSTRQRVWSLVISFVCVLFFGWLINLAPIPFWPKFSIFILAIILAIFFVYAFLAIRTPSPDDEELTDEDSDNMPSHIPPKPKDPPSVSAVKPLPSETSRQDEFEVSGDEVSTEQTEDNPSLYRHNFSVIPVIFKMVFVVILWVLLLVTALIMMTQVIWVIFGIATIIGPAYCYYIALRWNGEEFVVNNEWYERPLTMPFPFTSSTPAIRRTEIGQYKIRQTFIDKMIRTCRLFSDTPVENDEKFHNVKWLTHPAELRRATGISAPRKNSYSAVFRRRK
jgi:hypothetical protein